MLLFSLLYAFGPDHFLQYQKSLIDVSIKPKRLVSSLVTDRFGKIHRTNLTQVKTPDLPALWHFHPSFLTPRALPMFVFFFITFSGSVLWILRTIIVAGGSCVFYGPFCWGHLSLGYKVQQELFIGKVKSVVMCIQSV